MGGTVLSADDVASAIAYAYQQPQHVCIREIVLAATALVLQPFADRLGIRLIGTELEVVDGVLTGKLTGNNCRCENKVLRLEAVYGDLGE